MNLSKLEFNKFIEVGKLTKTMTHRADLCVVGSIIEKFKPSTILEYGPFLGGWCLFANNIVNDHISIRGVDNFFMQHWANQVNVEKGGVAEFPTTPKELENYIRNLSITLFNQPIDIKIIESLGSDFYTEEKFDLIRIDCAGYGIDEHYKILTNSIKMLSDDGLLVIEDISPMHFAKLHSFFRAYSQKKIFPVMYGVESIICTTNLEKQQVWVDKFKELQTLLDTTIVKVDDQKVWYVGAVITIEDVAASGI